MVSGHTHAQHRPTMTGMCLIRHQTHEKLPFCIDTKWKNGLLYTLAGSEKRESEVAECSMLLTTPSSVDQSERGWCQKTPAAAQRWGWWAGSKPDGLSASQPAATWALYVLRRWVTADSVQHFGLQPARLLCPWDSPDRNTGVGCHVLLQRVFPTQEWNPCLLCPTYYGWILYSLSHWGSPNTYLTLSKCVIAPCLSFLICKTGPYSTHVKCKISAEPHSQSLGNGLRQAQIASLQMWGATVAAVLPVGGIEVHQLTWKVSCLVVF